MSLFQLLQYDEEQIGLYYCPEGTTVEEFRKALLVAGLDVEEFEENNIIGAERVFVEEVYMPSKSELEIDESDQS